MRRQRRHHRACHLGARDECAHGRGSRHADPGPGRDHQPESGQSHPVEELAVHPPHELVVESAHLPEDLSAQGTLIIKANVDRGTVPTTLPEAAAALAGSDLARGAFGDDVVDHYLNAAKIEIDAYNAAVTDWELIRGFERL